MIGRISTRLSPWQWTRPSRAAQPEEVRDRADISSLGRTVARLGLAGVLPALAVTVSLIHPAHSEWRHYFQAPVHDTAGRGAAAVHDVQQHLGQPALSLRGQIPHYTAAGGASRDCADLVSSVLVNHGLLDEVETNVPRLEDALEDFGYHRIDSRASRPGDVWISANRQHTELVATPGGDRFIGANGHGTEYVTYNNYMPGTFYRLDGD